MTMTGIDLSNFPTQRLDWKLLIAVINPRMVLNHETLLPAIESEKGQVLEPIIAWKPSSDDPCRKRFNLKDTEVIILRGGRRHRCIRAIRENPEKYSHEIFENAGTVPVIVLEGITEEKARNLTLDDQDREPLLRFETILEVFRRFNADHNYQRVASDMTHCLYRILLGKGEAKYKAMLAIDDGKARLKEMQSNLRNGLDHWLYTAHLLNLTSQVIAWVKLRKDAVDLDEENGERLLFEAKPQNLVILRSVFSNSRDAGWKPITKIGIKDDGEPFVNGGNKEVEKELKKMMHIFRHPDDVEKEKVKLPKAAERNNVKDNARGASGKLFGAFYCGLDSEGRQEADDNDYFRGQREVTRTALRDKMSASMQALINAENGERDMAKLAEAYHRVNELVRLHLEQLARASKGKTPSKKSK